MRGDDDGRSVPVVGLGISERGRGFSTMNYVTSRSLKAAMIRLILRRTMKPRIIGVRRNLYSKGLNAGGNISTISAHLQVFCIVRFRRPFSFVYRSCGMGTGDGGSGVVVTALNAAYMYTAVQYGFEAYSKQSQPSRGLEYPSNYEWPVLDDPASKREAMSILFRDRAPVKGQTQSHVHQRSPRASKSTQTNNN